MDDILKIPCKTLTGFFIVEHEGLLINFVKRKHPGNGVVTLSTDEFLAKTRRPVLITCLIAVNEDVFEGFTEVRCQFFLERIQYSLPVKAVLGDAHFIHFQGFADDVIG